MTHIFLLEIITRMLDKPVPVLYKTPTLLTLSFLNREYLEDIDTTLALTLQGNKKVICSIGESQYLLENPAVTIV